jgi:hypoxanthine phosphoribosyltransferase
MLLHQAQKIQSQPYMPDIIVAVARGGLVPARILTDLLGATELAFIQIEFYTDINQTEEKPIMKQILTTQVMGKKTLLVDDIADTGETLKLAKNHLEQRGAEEIKIATIYKKPHSTTTPDYYEKQTANWVAFPWDIKETLRKIAKKKSENLDLEAAKLVVAGLPKELAEKLLKDIQ